MGYKPRLLWHTNGFIGDGCGLPYIDPTPNFLSKDFLPATRSRMEVLTKENLVRQTAPAAVSETFTPLPRRIRFPYSGFSFLSQILGVLSHHLKCEMKSPPLVDFS